MVFHERRKLLNTCTKVTTMADFVHLHWNLTLQTITDILQHKYFEVVKMSKKIAGINASNHRQQKAE